MSQNEQDENSMNKANMDLRSNFPKNELSGDSKLMAVDLLKRIEQL